MTDTPMTQDKHDTLIERLNKEMLHSVEMSKNAVFPENRDNFERLSSLFFDTLERLKQSQWVKIEDIPKEWKDGRAVHILCSGKYHHIVYWTKCKEKEDDWHSCIYDETTETGVGSEFDNITHGKLP